MSDEEDVFNLSNYCGPCNVEMRKEYRYDIITKEDRQACYCPKCKKWEWC